MQGSSNFIQPVKNRRTTAEKLKGGDYMFLKQEGCSSFTSYSRVGAQMNLFRRASMRAPTHPHTQSALEPDDRHQVRNKFNQMCDGTKGCPHKNASQILTSLTCIFLFFWRVSIHERRANIRIWFLNDKRWAAHLRFPVRFYYVNPTEGEGAHSDDVVPCRFIS